MCDKNGKESMITRWVDENDQQQIVRSFITIFSIKKNHMCIVNLDFGMW